MPIRPRKGEDQSTFMSRCVPTEMGERNGTRRPQEQAVAICLNAWREEHGEDRSAKIEQVWIPGDVGPDGLPVNFNELLALLAQDTGVPKEPGKPEPRKPAPSEQTIEAKARASSEEESK